MAARKQRERVGIAAVALVAIAGCSIAVNTSGLTASDGITGADAGPTMDASSAPAESGVDAAMEANDGADVSMPPGPPGLIAHLTFDEASGVVAKDIVGDHDGVIGFGTARVQGVSGGAFAFDGTNFVRVSSLDDANFPQSGTLAFWAKNDFSVSYANGVGFFDNWQSGREHLYVRHIENYLQAVYQGADSTYIAVTQHLAPPSNAWFKVAITWDVNASTGRLYVNDSVMKLDSTKLGWRPQNQRFIVGEHCTCAIDEVRLYGRALSDVEVAQIP